MQVSVRLILFSGGVESTLMLQESAPEDFIVTVLGVYPEYAPAYNPRSREIARYYNRYIEEVVISLPFIPAVQNVHQLYYFLLVASLWVVKFPEIETVCYGRYKGEPFSHNVETYRSARRWWMALYPEVPLVIPFERHTKKEQWDRIDPQVQPLISSCLYGFRCGQCRKCLEFNKLLEEKDE